MKEILKSKNEILEYAMVCSSADLENPTLEIGEVENSPGFSYIGRYTGQAVTDCEVVAYPLETLEELLCRHGYSQRDFYESSMDIDFEDDGAGYWMHVDNDEHDNQFIKFEAGTWYAINEELQDYDHDSPSKIVQYEFSIQETEMLARLDSGEYDFIISTYGQKSKTELIDTYPNDWKQTLVEYLSEFEMQNGYFEEVIEHHSELVDVLNTFG